MKAQFKYAFLEGLHGRHVVFDVTAALMLLSITLGSLGWLPEAALITAVSLGGVGIAAVLVVDVISDLGIARRMFAAPRAYLYALVPAHRGKTLFASVVTMLILDAVTMGIVIFGEVWLSLLLAGEITMQTVLELMRGEVARMELWLIFWGILTIMSFYLFVMMVAMLCSVARRTFLYQKPAAGLMAFVLACGCFYLFSLLQLAMIPFGTVERHRFFIQITLDNPITALSLYSLLFLISAAGLFLCTARLMEKRMNL